MATEEKTGRQIGGEKTSEGGRGEPTKASPAAIERYLKGIDYPASKQDLLKQAEQNGAPDDVMHVLNQFEEREYEGAVDVAKEVGRIE